MVGLTLSCGGDGGPGGPGAPGAPGATGSQTGPIFTEAALDSGLDFVHFNGMSGEFYMAEVISPGGALFDFDNDGDLDVYLVQGGMLGPGKGLDAALFPPRHALPLTDRLYRNDLETGPDGVPRLRFTDVTDGMGVSADSYGVGVTAGDYDNDGRVDLYVTNLGPNLLLHNDGDGAFSEVTAQAGASSW